MCDVHRAPSFACADCGRYFGTSSELCAHRHSHEQRICPTCGKAFKGRTLQRHIKLVHLKAQDIACSRCDAKFSASTSLYRHEYRVHGLRGETRALSSWPMTMDTKREYGSGESYWLILVSMDESWLPPLPVIPTFVPLLIELLIQKWLSSYRLRACDNFKLQVQLTVQLLVIKT